ncbi:MAG TPA: arylsulfatase [Candidatus Paceibacterota bacterium]|nr:arylsulfatase [Verrucomicrobiota bacterium]HSA09302.1 arylsulfatase [Candidatus Paceibacterota bacterium]
MTRKLLGIWRRAGRGLVLGLAGSLALPALSASTNRPSAALARRPNIIFILADDLGYGDLGCYGQTKIKTPNLDKLAADGMRFSQFYAGSTVCAPSRCVLMTGRHTGHALIRGNAKVALRPQDLTVAEVLHQAGYRTCLAGKWGLGNEHTTGVPQKKGFDEFIGYLDQVHAHDYYTDFLWRYDPPGEAKPGFDGRRDFPENQGGRKGRYMSDLFTTVALNFVQINKPDQFNKYRPFFLYLAYTIPHANNEEGRSTGNGMQVPSDAPYSDQSWPQPEKNKAAMITRMDADIGKLMDKLKQLKIEDNTIVFFSSDNGPHKEGGVTPQFFQSAGPLRGIKRDLYEGGIRVPMIVRWPMKIKAGTVNDQPWAFWDFLPTVAEVAQAKLPKDEPLDGLSFLPTLLGKPQTNGHEFLYWEFHERGFQQAVRMGEWKAVRLAAGAPLELFNLQTDPGEKENVAERNPSVVARIENYLKTARTESEHWPIKPATRQSAK